MGTKTFGAAPAYANYARAHVYSINIPECSAPGRMFVGQRKVPFAVNLGTIFDLVNAPPAVVAGGVDRASRALVPSTIADKNITTLALELPISCLTGTGDVIGGWTTASLRQARVINPRASFKLPALEGGAWTQVSRLSNPLVNEVVIGVPDKDRFNASEPKDDGQFADYVTNPTLPALLEVLFGGAGVKAPTMVPLPSVRQAAGTSRMNDVTFASASESVVANSASGLSSVAGYLMLTRSNVSPRFTTNGSLRCPTNTRPVPQPGMPMS